MKYSKVNLIINFAIQILLFGGAQLNAQSTQIEVNSIEEHQVERLSILSGVGMNQHLANRGYYRKEAVDMAIMADSILNEKNKSIQFSLKNIYLNNNEFVPKDSKSNDGSQNQVNKIEQGNVTFYSYDATNQKPSTTSEKYITNEKPLLKYFYKTPANFYQLDYKDFYLRVNPILNFSVGKDFHNDKVVFSNTRGFVIRGGIDDKVYFYSELLENQENYPLYYENYISKYASVPHVGAFKSYNSTIIDNLTGYDFFRATAYVGARITKHINVQIGHGNNFIGDGFRSLILSDFSPNYFYLKLNTKIWKLDYQNIYAELTAVPKINGVDTLLTKKYFVTHYLSTKINKNLSFGVFESVVFNRYNQFELQYLNPIIFYRTVEFNLGSPDNVMLGATMRWNLFNTISLYGQAVLDEFKFSEVIDRTGWWGNKYGFQGGVKYFDAFKINGLDVQLEANYVRPYTYSHKNGTASFANYNLPLAHPLGANFKEYLLRLFYNPTPKLMIQAVVINYQFGDDYSNTSTSYGGNVTKDYNNRASEYGNEIGQGLLKNITSVNFDINYAIYHNYQLFLQGQYRVDSNNTDDVTKYFGAGVRVNFQPKFREF